MIFGQKSDLKKHLSVKRQTYTHKVMVHSPLEHNQEQEMERREASAPDRDAPPGFERPEPIQNRY